MFVPTAAIYDQTEKTGPTRSSPSDTCLLPLYPARGEEAVFLDGHRPAVL